MLNNRAKNTALGLAALGLGGYFGCNYGRAPDVICPTEVRLLPVCGARAASAVHPSGQRTDHK
jgi:hypothetical protein